MANTLESSPHQAVLTESADSQAYWRKLKQRLKAEGDEIINLLVDYSDFFTIFAQ